MINIQNSNDKSINFWNDISKKIQYEIILHQNKMINIILTQILKENKHFYFITYKIPVYINNSAYLKESKKIIKDINNEFKKIRRKYNFVYVSIYGTRNKYGEFYLHRHLLIITSKYISKEIKNSFTKLDLNINIKKIRNDKNIYKNLEYIIKYQTKNYIESLLDKDNLKLIGINRLFSSSKNIISKDIKEIHKLYYIKNSLDFVYKKLENGYKIENVMGFVQNSKIRSVKLYPDLPYYYFENRIYTLISLLKTYTVVQVKKLLRSSIIENIQKINDSYGPFRIIENKKFLLSIDNNNNLIFTNDGNLYIINQ